MSYQPKSYRKFLATSVTAAMVATVAAPLAPVNVTSVDAASKFSDTQGVSSWAGDAIDYLVEKGAVKGYEDGTFRPHAQITRAEAAAILAGALELEISANPSLGFSDTNNNAWYAGAVEALVNAGVIDGFPNGTFQPNAPITRAALAKMVVEAYELDAPADFEIDFSDTVAGAWYEDYVQILALNGIVGGYADGTFKPNANVTRAESAVFVYRTEVEEARLDVEFPAELAEVETVKSVNSTTLEVTLVEADAELTAENFEVKVNGSVVTPSKVEAKQEGKVYTITHSDLNNTKGTVSVNGKEASFDYTQLQVQSVTAINAKQIEIKFNKAIDKSSVIDSGVSPAHDTIKDNLITLTRVPAGSDTSKTLTQAELNNMLAELKNDDTTLLLTLNDRNNTVLNKYLDGTYTFHMTKGVVGKTGELADAYTTSLTVNDQVAPEVTGVTYNPGTNQIEINLNKPVDILPTVRVDNGAPRPVTANNAGTKLTIENTATRGQTVSVSVSGAVDFKGNVQQPYTTNVNLVQNETPIQVSSIKQHKSNVVRVEFDKPIAGSNATNAAANVASGLTVLRGGLNQTFTVTRHSGDSTNRTFDVTFNAGTAPNYDIYPTGQDSTTLEFIFANESLTDVFGNTNSTIQRSVALNKDKVGPVVINSRLNAAETAIEIRFDEDIVASTEIGNVTVRKDGIDITVDFNAAQVSGKVLTLTHSSGNKIPNGTYTVRLPEGAVVDEHSNKNKVLTSNVTVEGSTAGEITLPGGAVTTSDTNEFTINYGRKMSNTAINLANYTLNGTALPEGTDIYFQNTDREVVVIKLPSKSVNYTSSDANLRIANVTTDTGSKVTSTTRTVTVTDNVPPKLTAASLSGNVLTLEFDENIAVGTFSTTADLRNSVEIKGGASTLTAGGTVSTSVDGKKAVLVITAGTSNWDTVRAASTITVKTLSPTTNLFTDIQGNNVEKDIVVNVRK